MSPLSAPLFTMAAIMFLTCSAGSNLLPIGSLVCGDFSFFSLDILGASLNGGFGRAYELAASDLLSDAAAAEALADIEAGAVAHMNEDHADALQLYATALLGARKGNWRATGLDPDGLDLALGDAVLRLPFPVPVDGPGPLRKVLADLAAQARAAAQAPDSPR